MSMIEVTPHLKIDADEMVWICRNCDTDLVDAEQNYKRGCLVAERDPSEVHRATIDEEYNFAPDSDWCRIVEFYCPECGSMIENEYLPPGHPITDDIDLDLEMLREESAGTDEAVERGGAN